ncbi:MAG: DUF63 family protein [Candidatus Thalassarchaeaceae archaeon]|jgi:uncharacterized membrane protein|nr:DUF63 family protein [Candidatus Thalassarchaeaceae archaeon]
MSTDEKSLIVETPLSDNQFSQMERFAAAIIVGAVVLLVGAILGDDIAPGNSLTETVETNFFDPLNEDSTEGDAGYNPVDTITYSVLLVSFVVVISAWLRRMGITSKDSALLALLPWVFWAALGEVNEDGSLFQDRFSPLFVSPIVHFHVAAWVIAVAFMSHAASQSKGVGGSQGVTQLAVLLTLFHAVIYLPQFLMYWPIETASPLVWTPLVGIVLIIALHPFLESMSFMEQGLIQVGIGACFIQLSGWLSMYYDPLNTTESAVLWPLLVCLFAPLIICIILWVIGQPSRRELHHMGLEAGLIPTGISLDDWENQHSSTFDRLEQLTPRAILGTPVILVAMYGQMVDGLATFLGVDHFGYSEKHVLSQKVIDLTGGAWGFAILKFGIAGLIWFLFSSARFEQRHRHLRLLVILCLLVVGLAPGLRDILRLTVNT